MIDNLGAFIEAAERVLPELRQALREARDVRAFAGGDPAMEQELEVAVNYTNAALMVARGLAAMTAKEKLE